MDPKKSTYYKVGGIVIALMFTYGLAAFIVPNTLVSLTKAAPAARISIMDSKIIGEKMLARADGKDECIVDVFILDKTYKGVAKKQVVLSGLDSIEPKLILTDNEGKTSFKMTSSLEGTFELTATVEGSPLARPIKVTFRN